MHVHITSGDPLLTRARALAFGWNAAGAQETTPLGVALHARYPAAFSMLARACRRQELHPGDLWIWRDALPTLVVLLLRDSAHGITRARFVDAALLRLARDHALERLTTLAVAPLGAAHEAEEHLRTIARWLTPTPMPIVAYREYLPGVAAEDSEA